MKYKHKFYLLIMIAFLYNLLQMLNGQESSDKRIESELKKIEIYVDPEHCESLRPK